MSPAGSLRHRCIIERDRAPYAPDAQRNHVADYQAIASDVPCRLVAKTQRVPDGVLAESPVITTYVLLLSARQDIHGGKVDRITHVTDHGGNLVDAGPFTVEQVLRRSGGVGASHISISLERQGGKA